MILNFSFGTVWRSWGDKLGLVKIILGRECLSHIHPMVSMANDNY